MNIRTLEARPRRVEVGRLPEPKAWVDRYLQIHADSGLPHDERERLRSIVATPAEREWFHRAILALSTDPVHEPWRLLEQSSDAIRRLGEVWRSGGPDQAREAWWVVVEYERTILPLLNEYLASKGRPALPSEQEDRDLARYWSLAAGAWPWTQTGAAV